MFATVSYSRLLSFKDKHKSDLHRSESVVSVLMVEIVEFELEVEVDFETEFELSVIDIDDKL